MRPSLAVTGSRFALSRHKSSSLYRGISPGLGVKKWTIREAASMGKRPSLTLSVARKAEIFEQPIDERRLARQDFFARLLRREPSGGIDFGKALLAAALRRPFELETIRREGRGIEIALDGEGRDHLLARLLYRAEIEQRAGRKCAAELLGELALGRRKRIFVFAVFALRDRPGALVLVRPERTARMREQKLDPARGAAIHQDAGAELRHDDMLNAKKPPRNSPAAAFETNDRE